MRPFELCGTHSPSVHASRRSLIACSHSPPLRAGAVGHGSPDLEVQPVCARPQMREQSLPCDPIRANGRPHSRKWEVTRADANMLAGTWAPRSAFGASARGARMWRLPIRVLCTQPSLGSLVGRIVVAHQLASRVAGRRISCDWSMPRSQVLEQSVQPPAQAWHAGTT